MTAHPGPMNLADLIDAHHRDRSRADLARAAGVSSNTIKNWSAGVTPLPEFRAAAIAAWLGVKEKDVLAAAAESRRVALTGAGVGPDGQGESHAHGGRRRKGLMADERDEIVGALSSIGQQLIDLAKKIDAAGRDSD